MSTNPRKKRHLKKIITAYIFLSAILGLAVFLVNLLIISRKPLFINPIGKANTDKASVEKILKDNGILFSDVTLSDCCYVVSILNNGQIKLSKTKDIHEQVASLQRILRELTIEGKPFKGVDFRYSNPIIAF